MIKKLTAIFAIGLLDSVVPARLFADSPNTSQQITPKQMAAIAAYEAIQQKKIQDIRLPKNSDEEKEYDEACLKGPRTFYEKFLNDKTLKGHIPEAWTRYHLSGTPLEYCHEQITQYRNAKKDPAGYYQSVQ